MMGCRQGDKGPQKQKSLSFTYDYLTIIFNRKRSPLQTLS